MQIPAAAAKVVIEQLQDLSSHIASSAAIRG